METNSPVFQYSYTQRIGEPFATDWYKIYEYKQPKSDIMIIQENKETIEKAQSIVAMLSGTTAEEAIRVIELAKEFVLSSAILK